MESSLPTVMKAWTHTRPGSPPDVLTLSSTLKRPEITKPTDVLVRTSYASLNPGGSIMIALCPSFLRTWPAVPELDFSGHVVATGASVPASRGLDPGTAVFGSIPVAAHIQGNGALAEYIVVDASYVVPKPENVGLEAAAGLTVAGCTALDLVNQARVKKGDKVLVYGASGGIGSLVVQLVRDIVGDSGVVIGVCSARNVEMVKRLGAHEVLDYQALNPIHEYLTKEHSASPFNVIIDARGVENFFTYSSAYLSSNGTFATVGNALEGLTFMAMVRAGWLMIKDQFLPSWLGGVPRKYARPASVVTLEGLETLRKLSGQGTVRGVVDSVWGMEEVGKAYEKLLSKRAAGKVVVKVREDL